MRAHERIWTTMNHEEPDRVPTLVQIMEPGFIRRYDEEVEVSDDYGFPMNRFDLMIAKELGLDSMWVHSSKIIYPEDLPETPSLPSHRRVTAHGHVMERNPETGESWYVDGVLKTPELIREWISYLKECRPTEEEYYRTFARDVWQHGCEHADIVPIPTAGGPIYTTWASVGMDRLALMMRKHPQVLADLFMEWGRLTAEEFKCFFEQGVDLIFVCDDHAFKDRLMFSSAQYERFVVPVYELLSKTAHDYGAKLIVHTDGYLAEAIPHMIKAGVDAVEPLEYEAGNRLGPLKEQYGRDITLIGNVAATWVLCHGTEQDTVAATRQVLDDAMAGGGYVCAPGSDVLACTRIENMRAMIRTVHEYGTYKQ